MYVFGETGRMADKDVEWQFMLDEVYHALISQLAIVLMLNRCGFCVATHACCVCLVTYWSALYITCQMVTKTQLFRIYSIVSIGAVTITLIR